MSLPQCSIELEENDNNNSARGQRRQKREQRKQQIEKGAEDHDSAGDSDADLLKSMANMKVSEGVPAQHKGTGFIYDELFARHKCEWDSSYPECPERVLQSFARCQELGLVERCTQIPMTYATEDQIQWHHLLSHLELAKEAATMTPEQRQELGKKYDAWYSNQATFECSLAAAGSAIQLMDHILQKKITNGFAMLRPPGHHAMQNEFCGYCTFNNAAFAATHALNHGVERILIVDWDVHHGQATQHMFYNDPRVMYFSIHRYERGEFWPNLRESDYDFIGTGPGKGFNVNVPLNETGLGDSDYMAIFHQLLIPLAYEFSPQVVIISSGYDAALGCPEFNPEVVLVSCGLDAAIGDEKGEMLVSPAAYAHFTHFLSSLCEGRVCVLLEGGYCLKSLAEGCALTLRSLLCDPCPQLPPMTEPSDSVISSILNVIKVLRPYWRCFDNFETLQHYERCLFEDVNTFPPKEGVEFMTPENQPSEFEIMGFYPVQNQETLEKFSHQIDCLIAEASLTKAPHRTCFIFDAAMRTHRNLFDRSHPERPRRISSIFDKHREWGLLNRCLQLKSRFATEEEILAVHSDKYLQDMKESAALDDEALRSRPNQMKYNSIYMCQNTYDCALLAAGCVLQVTETVLSGKAQNGVAVVRPPGHHAECDRAMGFCFFNNVAIAATYAMNKFQIQRILILDWDVHHGNATQHMFYEDPRVLYISLHRFEHGFYFPGSPEAGHMYVGQGEGKGFNVNIPWNKGKMGNAEYMAAFQRIVMPIAYQFAPQLVLVSAGFDAAVDDFLGGYSVTPECYGQMTHMLSSLANGRIVLALEGGYNAAVMAASMSVCTSVLLGDPCPPLKPGTPNSHALQTIREVLNVQQKYWKSLKFAVSIPSVENDSVDQERMDALGKKTKDLDESAVSATEGGVTEGFQESECTTDPKEVQEVKDKPPRSPGSGDSKPASPEGDVRQLNAATQKLSLSDSDTVLEAGGIMSGEKTRETVEQAECGAEGTKSADCRSQASETTETLGAAGGGAWRPNTVADILKMEGVEQLYAVQPLPWCPHLVSVRPLPPQGLDTDLPCEECGDVTENWVCLVCYKVLCSRFVQEHMQSHSIAEEHLIALSYADLSVWCYACNDYVDNEATYEMKNAAHCRKFGEPLPNLWVLD